MEGTPIHEGVAVTAADVTAEQADVESFDPPSWLGPRSTNTTIVPDTVGEQAIVRFIRYRREAVGMSRMELAAAVGVCLAGVEELELGTGARAPGIVTAVCAALGIDEFTRGSLERQAIVQSRTRGDDIEAVSTVHDRTDIDAHSYPASMLAVPSFGVVAHNQPYRMAFPGIESTNNMMEWLVTDAIAKHVLPEWELEALRVVQWFKATSDALIDPHERRALIDRCAESRDWDQLWNTDLPPSELLSRTMALMHPITKEVRQYWIRITESGPTGVPAVKWALLPMNVRFPRLLATF
ncbi:hypothetical protein [Nocardia sp. CNY236]|uniref:MmyB family transcriptional regulator n=1 Tax=Nocardia sp. CNY236 TaxID=1169152 RepID=UPI0003FE93BC|nr:hypothetical protein [Nocardia sp. CNY236]